MPSQVHSPQKGEVTAPAQRLDSGPYPDQGANVKMKMKEK